MHSVHKWQVFELDLASETEYAQPTWDVSVKVTFTRPSGGESTVDAFWDGRRRWRARFSPDETGRWQWRSQVHGTEDAALDGVSGAFECVPYQGNNPLYAHGAIQLSEDRRHLQYADGTPFFWLGDTAWNGVLRARAEDWSTYLDTRRAQGFTAIQYVCTHWRGCSRDPLGETAFQDDGRLRINPEFFQRMEAKVSAINSAGLVAAPVILWALTEADPGRALSEENAIHLAKYIVARWGAHNVVWFLGGDGHYYGEHTPRWHRIGRAVFGDRHDRLVTMHPCGLSWVAEELRDEEWFDFIGYQSGHGDGDNDLRWLTEGPPASGWQDQPARPIINLEPNYEGHPAYQSKQPHTDQSVRRAAYWSMLVTPPAGVSYGTNPIWVWPEGVEDAEGHANLRDVPPWREGLELPGIRQMTILREFFEGLPWTQLWPAPELISNQPGVADPARHVAAAKTHDGTVAVIYTPCGSDLVLDASALRLPGHARWFDPRTSETTDIGPVHGLTERFTPPDDADWVLVFRSDG